ncbi:hypothetical protein [Streptomyces sp. NPDC048277]|uniref:hypothetical protein n=1 Tax=Streptomyces sp. NPDC048277 TaxID=3155027 RepID=UPI0033DB4AF0
MPTGNGGRGLPPNAVVEAIDQRAGRIRLSAASPWLLDADFRLVDAPDRTELAAENDQVRQHYADALTAPVADGADPTGTYLTSAAPRDRTRSSE